MRSGIIAGGNWIRDHVKSVDAWPEQDGLANILGRTDSNGGGPYNLLKDLARLGAPFPLEAAGLVGDDADGHAILADCRLSEIDTTRLRPVPGSGTSYTDVISVRGRRTFFHERGANALLGPEHFGFGPTTAKLFYLGYLLLLDRLDAPGPDGRPAACAVLQAARQAGLITVADCVSAAPGAFGGVFPAVLAGIDVLFVNDFEAEQITGLELGRGPALNPQKAGAAARRLIELGVRSWAVVHFPEGACACSASGEAHWQPAARVPADMVASAVGAGDAFAAGVLLGIHENWPMARSLELGVCAAAASLLHPTCSGGVLPADECLALGQRQGFLGAP
ncbi:MAG TPA: carbohydrate kinase family protein [Opitutaceae bacterium]|jgi:sugar/nucleoside kinase (ribokinase family)